ncbi:hypothetical protein BV20DRAFT_1057073 [Pilatotrama ljubarskyi]|nr:hypothetical protein BV20DRAFT_1057073 [Pilatotrama ljubarskyi]
MAEKGAGKDAEKGVENGAEEGAENTGDDLRISWPVRGGGQKTRRAIMQLYLFLNDEIKLRKELITEDLHLIKGAVTKAVDTALKWWTDSEVRHIVREKVKKVFAEHLMEEGEDKGEEGKKDEGEDAEEEEDEAE